MYIIRPEINDIPDLDEACLWVLVRCFAKRANNETKFSFPSYQTIADDCGWSRNKAIYVVEKLVELGIIKKEARFREKGGQTSNNYQLDTDLVFVATKLKSEVTKIEPEEVKEPECKNCTPPSAKIALPQCKNCTLTRASIELTPSSKKINSETENFENWEPNPNTLTTISRACPDLTPTDVQTELAKFRLYHPEPPRNIEMKFISWCQRANGDYSERKTQSQIAQTAQELAAQRVKEFHEKKRENIAKVGTNTRNKDPAMLIIDPSDYGTHEEYLDAIDEANDKSIPHKILEPSITRYRMWGVDKFKMQV